MEGQVGEKGQVIAGLWGSSKGLSLGWGPRVTRAMWIAKPRPGRSVSGTGSLITIIKKKKKIFLSRRCSGIILPFWGLFSLICSHKLSGA